MLDCQGPDPFVAIDVSLAAVAVTRWRGAIFAVGSLSWALAQWLLVWMFARFGGGAAVLGEYSLALSVATPVFTISQFGLRTVQLSLRERFPWRTYVMLRSVGVFLAVVVVSLWGMISESGATAIWWSVLFVKSADAFVDLLQGRIQRNNKLMLLGVFTLANSVLTVILAAAFLFLYGSVALAVFASGVVSLAIAVAIQIRTFKMTFEPGTSSSGVRDILRAGFPTTLAEGLASLSAYLPLLVLSWSAGPSSIGVFAAAAYLLTLANLAGSITKNILITPFRLLHDSEGYVKLRRRARRVTLAAGAAGVFAAPFIIVFGGSVLRFVYGESFVMDHAQLALLAAAFVPIVPAYVYSVTFNVVQRFASQAWIWASTVGCGLAVGLALTVARVEPLIAALVTAVVMSWVRLIVGYLTLSHRS
ncbi:lipopolysaccharide biosynthesis protein [Microbacterium sp. NPDC089987]|uniref:lipopolysaccharide biosynthesis protein n=1 Tax=Microbacterium sp. NPDC089987 TaxID=3364202 RepID=UPI0038210294